MTENYFESVASMSAITGAAQTATFTAAQTANFIAAQTANFIAAHTANFIAAQIANFTAAQTASCQSIQTEPIFDSTEPFLDHMLRSSKGEVLSLYGGGKEFGVAKVLIWRKGSSLPSEDQGPPISEQLAKIINAKFSMEFDHQKCKAILEKNKCQKIANLVVPRVNPEIWTKLPTNRVI